jgi:flagellar L-ring protein precursor FlgH
MRQNTSRALPALLWALVVAGCTTPPPKPDDPAYAPVRPMQPPPPAQVATGSLYRAGYDVRLFEDSIARRVGDILTIRLEEKTDAKKKADTGIGKDSTFDGGIDLGTSGLSAKPFGADLKIDASRDFDGTGQSKQSNSLKGDISVVVSEVLPNGNLMVRGEKWLTLNQGDEFIRVTGIVRPQDVEPDNSISSYLVADARISYGGTGPVADSNAVGWLTRFFTSPFAPI